MAIELRIKKNAAQMAEFKAVNSTICPSSAKPRANGLRLKPSAIRFLTQILEIKMLERSQRPRKLKAGEIKMTIANATDGLLGQIQEIRDKYQLNGSLGSATPKRKGSRLIPVASNTDRALEPSGAKLSLTIAPTGNILKLASIGISASQIELLEKIVARIALGSPRGSS
jgi:hypothetical protein